MVFALLLIIQTLPFMYPYSGFILSSDGEFAAMFLWPSPIFPHDSSISNMGHLSVLIDLRYSMSISNGNLYNLAR